MVSSQVQLHAIRNGLMNQQSRREAFSRAHPGAEFPPGRVGGLLLAWVPFGSGGVQFSGRTETELLDDAEQFFRDAELDSG